MAIQLGQNIQERYIECPTAPHGQDNLSVGKSHIDAQHKQLIILCARAAECASATSHEALKEFHDILNDLAVLTDKHFADEEDLLIKKRKSKPRGS